MYFKELSSNWTVMAPPEAETRYDIADLGSAGVRLIDLFRNRPARVYVHRGDITTDGPLTLGHSPGEEEETVYVIDGNLSVGGTFCFENNAVYTSLYVTGSVTAQSLLCMWDCCLFIGGSLRVADLLMTYLTDAGHLVVNGPASVGAWLELWDRGCVEFRHAPVNRRVRIPHGGYDEEADALPAAGVLLPAFLDGDAPDTEDLMERISQAALAGRPLLCSSTRGGRRSTPLGARLRQPSATAWSSPGMR